MISQPSFSQKTIKKKFQIPIFSREYRGKLIKMSTIWLSPCKKKGKGAPKNIFGAIFRKSRPNYSIHAKINLFERNLNFAPPHHFQHSATPRFAMSHISRTFCEFLENRELGMVLGMLIWMMRSVGGSLESLTPSSRRVIQGARDRRARLGPDEDGEGEEIVVLGFQLEVKPQFEVFKVCDINRFCF